nr:hypothetical protein [Tanacetum cinerariifolium]
MSNSEDSAVTYTSVYTDSEPERLFWATDEEVSEGGVPRVIVYGYDGFPIQPVPQDEDEREPKFIQAHDPDFVPKPVYPEYILLEDEHVLPTKKQPLPPVDSPTIESPGYVTESDPKEDLEYEDDEEQDGPVDYPMGEGDNEGDDDGDSSRDDAADEDKDMEEEEEDEEEEEQEEEHIASADSTTVIPVVELVSSPEGTKPVLPPPSIDITTTGAKISDLTDVVTATLPSSSVDRRDEIPKSERPPRKRSCLFTIRSRDVGYGIKDTWIDPAEAVPALTPTTVEEVNTRFIELAELHEHDIQNFHALLRQDDPPGDSMDCGGGGLCCLSGMEPLNRTESCNLPGASDSLDMRREMSDMQKELISQREQLRRERQPGPDARFPNHQEILYVYLNHDSDLTFLSFMVRQIMVRTRRGQTSPPTNLNNMTPEAVQTMIDQALLRNSGGGDGSHSSHAENPRNMHTARPCYYADFMKCHPLNFKRIEGTVGLTRWIKKMESVSTSAGVLWKIKSSLLPSVLKKKMTDKYCPLKEVKKLKIKLWNLKVRDNNIPTYTNRFQELALICTKFVSNETEKKLRTYMERKSDSKRKADDIFRNNQQPFK